MQSPRAPGNSAPTPRRSREPGGRARILAADDQAAARAIYEGTLGGAVGDFDVTLVARGDAAIEKVALAKASDRPYAVAFLDRRMPPGPGGVETASALHRLDPKLQLVLASEPACDAPPELEGVSHLAKPLQPLALRELARALAARHAAETALDQEIATLRAQLDRQNNALTAAREEAATAVKTKDAFLSTVGHELRTPLNVIMGFADILKGELFGPLGGRRYVDYARDIHDSATGLLGVVNNILDMAEAQARGHDLLEEPVDVRALIAQVAEHVRPKAEAGGLTLQISVPTELPDVMADPAKCRQILQNLASNAVKFTPPRGRVAITAELRPREGLAIRVRDNGVGMAPEDVDLALTPFTQIDNRYARAYEGAGLGLPIAKALAEAHDAELLIETAPGVGLSAILAFPMARVIGAPEAEIIAIDAHGSEPRNPRRAGVRG